MGFEEFLSRLWKLPLRSPCCELPPTPWPGLGECWEPWRSTTAWPGARLLAQLWEHPHSSMKGNTGGRSRVDEMQPLIGQGFKKKNTSLGILGEKQRATRWESLGWAASASVWVAGASLWGWASHGSSPCLWDQCLPGPKSLVGVVSTLTVLPSSSLNPSE